MLVRMVLVACALGFGGGMFTATPAYAMGQASGQQGTIANNCQKFQGLVNRFGSCIKETITQTAVQYFDKMYSYFLTALNIFLTLGIVVYGVFLAAGMVDNIKRDSMVVLLKVAFVAFFAANLETIYFWVVDMMDGLIDIFFQFTTSQDEGQCSTVSQGFGPFSRLDCLLDLVIGIKSGSYQGSYSQKISGDGVGRGLLNFFFKAGISSSLGMIIAGLGFFIVFTLIMTIIKITFMYLMALIALSFMVMLGPIFIPLVIFRQTKMYFDNWVRLIVSFGLQPVIMFAYVAMMIIAFDKAVFSGSNSLMGAIAGQQSSSNFNLNQWMQSNNAVKRGSYGSEIKADDSTKDSEGQRSGNESLIPNTVFRDNQDNGSGGGNGSKSNVKTYAQKLPINMMDWKKLAEARGKAAGRTISEKDLMKDIMYAIIYCALVIYVFTTMLNYIPSLGVDISGGGGGYQSNLWQQNPLEAGGKQLMNNLRGGLNGLLGRMGGNKGGGRQ